MNVLIYDTIPHEAVNIRQMVFVEEQGFHNEFDEIDECAKHIVLYDHRFPVATCRVFVDKFSGNFIIGRIAVVKQYRGKNIGSFILKCAENEIEKRGGKSVFLHAQLRAKEFYEKQGYRQYGKEDFEEYCPHIWMHKTIGSIHN